MNNIKDPVIKSFWIHEYETWRDQYRNEAIAPIQNKVGQFLSTAMVRNVLGQSKSTIDLFEMMNSGKIFLVNVSKGRIGEDNSALLGGMLITKLQLAAMERVRIPEDERKDFYLYVDEFQNFVTDSFASILSEARKYRLCLCLAHQYIAQLVTKDSDAVRDAVFGNVGTMIIFRVGAADADFLEKEFEPEFMIQDMVSLPNYHIYLKLMVDGITSRPFSAKTLPPFKIPVTSNVAETIIESSRKLYARPREVVEKEISAWSGMLVGVQDEGKFKAECSSCGKVAMVPFEPEPGRPVYCKECIAKIKSGELKPIKGVARQRIEPESFDALSNLGIEFTHKGKPTPIHIPARQARPDSKPTTTFTARPTTTSTAKPFVPKSTPTVKQAVSVATATADTTDARKSVAPKAVAPVVANDKPKTFVKNTQPRERKPADHDGLQNILKQALGEALGPNGLVQKNTKSEVVVEEVPVVKQTISLADLKKPDGPIVGATSLQTKTASTERVSALADAIARARTTPLVAQTVDAGTASDVPSVPISVSEKPTVTIEQLPPEKVPEPLPVVDEASLVTETETTVTHTTETESVHKTKTTTTQQTVEKNTTTEQQTETPDADTSKRVREVPEDILRKVLSE